MLTANNYIYILLISFLISENTHNMFSDYQAGSSDVNLILSIWEKDFLERPVKGVQFDLFYNPDEIIHNESTCLIEGLTFEYVEINQNQIRFVLFNLDAKLITPEELNRLVNASFTQINNFYAQTRIYLDNVIIVGEFGENISSNYQSSAFEVNFDVLRPKYSSIYALENNIFNDTLSVSFQLDETSYIDISLYDQFNQKKKTLINEYLNLGVYDIVIDSYDQNQEKISEGLYKIVFSSNNSSQDSIYVIYQNSKK